MTWLIHMCDMTHSYVWHDSFICVICLITQRHITRVYVCITRVYVWHDSHISHMSSVTYDMTHPCGRQAYMRVTYLIHLCSMPHSRLWHDSFTYATSLIHIRDMTHLHAWHDSFMCVTWLFTCATWLIHMCDVTCATWLIHMCDVTCATWLIHTCDVTCATWLIHMCDEIMPHMLMSDFFVTYMWMRLTCWWVIFSWLTCEWASHVDESFFHDSST